MPMLDPRARPRGRRSRERRVSTRRRAGPAPAGGRPALPAPRPRRRARRSTRRRRDRSTAARSPRFEDDAGADVRIDATRLRGAAGLRRLPHAPAVRRLARGRVRDEGHRRPVRGDRAQRRRDRVVGAGVRAPPRDEAVLAQARTIAARDARAPARRRSRARPATASPTTPSARAVRLGRALGEQVEQTMAMTGAVRPRRARRLRPRTRGWTRSSASRTPTDVDALDIYVESVAFANEHLERLGAHRRRARAAAARARRAVRREPLGAGRAGRRRALGRPPRVPAPRRPRRRSRPAECAAVLLPGAEFLGAEALAPARALADAGAICVLGTDLNPGTSPVASMPAIVGLAVRRYGWSRPRGAARVHAERGVGARPVRRASARSRSASAPT